MADVVVGCRFDPRLWIKKNMVPTANATGEGTTKDDGLAIAGARGTGKAMTSKLSVEIVNEEDDEARRQEKQSEANAKRYVYSSFVVAGWCVCSADYWCGGGWLKAAECDADVAYA